MQTYLGFSAHAKKLKLKLLSFLIASCNAGQRICIFGNSIDIGTFVHYCDLDRDFVDHVADPDSSNHGMFTPGKRIPIRSVDDLRTLKPDVVLLHPHCCARDLMRQLEFVREWGGKLLVAHPDITAVTPRP